MTYFKFNRCTINLCVRPSTNAFAITSAQFFLALKSSKQRSKRNEFYFVGLVNVRNSQFFASKRKSRNFLIKLLSQNVPWPLPSSFLSKFHGVLRCLHTLTNLHIHLEIRSAYLFAHVRKNYRSLSLILTLE